MDLSRIVHDFKPNKRQKIDTDTDKFFDSISDMLHSPKEKKISKAIIPKNRLELLIQTNGEKICIAHNIVFLYTKVRNLYFAMNPKEYIPRISIYVTYENDKYLAEWSNVKVKYPDLMNIIIKSELDNHTNKFRKDVFMINTELRHNQFANVIKYNKEFREYASKWFNTLNLPYIKIWKFNKRDPKVRSKTIWMEFYVRENYITQDQIYELFHIFVNNKREPKRNYY